LRARAPSAEPAAARDWWHRHPWLTILAINLVVVGLAVLGAEAFLRFYLPYNPGYYMAFEEQPGVYRFPYGTITYNSQGFPDDEFDLATPKPRVGYFGDSVTRGVGAGEGYRISDLLETAYPEHAHWTFGTVREGVDEPGAQRILELAEAYDLDRVVYLLNLNDILPSNRFARPNQASWLARAKASLAWLDRLRGGSYLYSVIRSQVRLLLAARGYGYQGWKAAELFPAEHAQTVRETAERVSRLAEQLERRGVTFLVILLPYEMQVSAAAARKYWELGIRWEAGFLAGSTQKRLIEDFSYRVQYFDGREAFLKRRVNDGPASDNGLGQYFVYNKGDKLDWNHPNRAGHRQIADWLADQDFLDPPPATRVTATSRSPSAF
jgi:lysophospholipase L1-like esterase